MAKQVTYKEWKGMGEKLYGNDMRNWKFKCPVCGNVQTIQEFIDLKIKHPERYVYYSCIGRWIEDRGCNWTLGGLFQVHKIEVIADGGNFPVFEFADSIE